MSLRTSIELDAFTQLAVFRTTVTDSDRELTFAIERGGVDTIKRYLGCAIMFALPDEGVDEAFESLKSVWENNCDLLGLPPARNMVARRRSGKIVGSSVRPELEIPS